LRACDTVAHAAAGLERYLAFSNTRCTRQAPDWSTPDKAYFQTDGLCEAA
jgi:hypothetical protein